MQAQTMLRKSRGIKMITNETEEQREKRLIKDRKRHKARYDKIKSVKAARAKKAKEDAGLLTRKEHERKQGEKHLKEEAKQQAKRRAKRRALETSVKENVIENLPALTDSVIDLSKAVSLRAEGMSCREIAVAYGVSESKVSRALGRYSKAIREIDTFRNTRADQLAAIQAELLNSIDLKGIKKASLQQRVLAFAVLYDKERLEQDKSTANIKSLHITVHDIKQAELDKTNIVSDI